MDSDNNTIYGVYLNLEGETDGLGAEIKDNLKLQQNFQGKKFHKDGLEGIALVVETVAHASDLNNVDAVSGATYSSTGILTAVKLALAKAAVAPTEEADPEQAASEEVVEEAAPSEAAEPEKTPVTAPTVEVVQPEEKSAVSAWFKEVWQQLFPAEIPDDSEPEPASSAEALPTSEAALPPEETDTEPESEGAAE